MRTRPLRLMALVTVFAVMLGICSLRLHAGESMPGFTAEEQEFISTHATLRIGYVTDRIPVSFEDENGEFAGISRYIFDRVSELCGLSFEYVPLPTGDVTYDYLLGEHLDLVSSVEYNRENQHARGILMSDPYFSGRKVVVAREGLEFRYDAALSIAVSTGSQTLKKALGTQYPNFEIVDYSSISECFDAVNSAEADLLMQNQYVAEYWLAKPIYEKLKVIPVLGLDDQLCFSAVVSFGGGDGMPQESGEILIGILNKAIDAMSEDEVGSYIIQGIMDNQYRYNFSDFIYRYRFAFRTLLISLIVILVLVLLSARQHMRLLESKADERVKNRFLSTMSHEIRTPLNGIIGLNYLMLQKLDDQKKLREYLRQSDVTANYLLSLVNDMLDMSNIQSDKIELELKPVELDLLFGTINSITESAMTSAGLKYSTDADIKWSCILGDEVRIQQVILHLLDNARKFTPRGGMVRLTVRQNDMGSGKIQTTATVTDTGRGLSDDLKKHVFDAFVRDLGTVSKGTQGTGLGLTISRRLAQLMGGDLSVESEKEKGSTFIFTFIGEQTESPDREEPASLKSSELPKILVAEDNELNAEIITELLKECGYESTLAENGRVALDTFTASEPGSFGIILMDLLMPEMDGFETAKAIRESGRTDSDTVRIIACSANSSSEDRQLAEAAGMNGFIEKPVDIGKLLEMISEKPE